MNGKTNMKTERRQAGDMTASPVFCWLCKRRKVIRLIRYFDMFAEIGSFLKVTQQSCMTFLGNDEKLRGGVTA